MTADGTEATRASAAWLELLAVGAGQASADAVATALAAVQAPDPLSARLAFAKLNRSLKATPLPDGATTREVAALLGPSYLQADVPGRVAFVIGLAERFAPLEFADVVTTLYRTGSDREQVGILRAVSFVPAPRDLVSLAREASRTNDIAVFSALACESAFPAEHLPDAAFEQLVLKALFVGVSLERVQRLETRVTPELKRMVADFARERAAAGRPVPDDVPRLLEATPQSPRSPT